MDTLLTKHELILLRNALKHYIQYQVGLKSPQAEEYKEIMKVLEQHL